MKLENIKGMRYGRLIVLRKAPSYVSPKGEIQTVWFCRCDCGTIKKVRKSALRHGLTTSCGCWNSERASICNRIHGKSKDRVYRIWSAMIYRCTNRNCEKYNCYGGRGIKVCKRWMKFENFLSDMGEPKDNKLSIERKNNNGNYEPGNCRWGTQAEQTRNTRRNVCVKWKNKTHCLKQWSEITGINPSTLYGRNRKGWTVERLFSQP